MVQTNTVLTIPEINEKRTKKSTFFCEMCAAPVQIVCVCSAVSESWVFDGDAFIFCHPFAIFLKTLQWSVNAHFCLQ